MMHSTDLSSQLDITVIMWLSPSSFELLRNCTKVACLTSFLSDQLLLRSTHFSLLVIVFTGIHIVVSQPGRHYYFLTINCAWWIEHFMSRPGIPTIKKWNLSFICVKYFHHILLPNVIHECWKIKVYCRRVLWKWK